MTDDREIRDLQKKMQDTLASIKKLAPLVGMARQVKEFNADQRKNALAGEQMKFITRGESVASSETNARSSPTYLEKMSILGKSYADACGTIAEWEAQFARLDALRSMLAMTRETMRTLDG